MAKKIPYYDLKNEILQKIKKNGGWVNAHAHLDRAYTITPEKFEQANALRAEKWKLNADIRQSSSVDDIYDRMAAATELLLEQGVVATASFIDVDPDVKDKAIRAAQRVRDTYKSQMTYKFINQSSYGIFTESTREWYEVGVEFVDIIGGLLASASPKENDYLDILMESAKQHKKMIHVHVDENNIPEEKETELLARKTIEHGLEGKVVGIHGISINAHPKEYRNTVYELMEQAKLIMVACPLSWSNARRNETVAPIHNAVTPADELIPRGIPVAVGIDNLYDVFMPFNDGNIWNDLRLLMEANRYYDIDAMVDVATVNGRKALGIK